MSANLHNFVQSGFNQVTSYCKVNEHQGGSASNLIKEYFSQVPCKLLQDVYSIYKIDFDLFEYEDISYYLSICKKG